MTDENNSARIENILGQIRKLKEQYEKCAAITGEDFNVFEVLGVERREVRHSAMLANLLNPKGPHRQGAVFLEHFLNLEPRLADSSSYGKLDDFQVITEAATNANDGRIDIRLKKEGYACIIIENKIDAEDGDGQLNKYYRDAKAEGFTDKQIKLIYLTLYGEPPSENSLAGQELLDINRVICISYESHITKWLEDCLREVAEIVRIQEILLQYEELIKKLTGQPINKDLAMEIGKILTKEHDFVPKLESSTPEDIIEILTKEYDLIPDLESSVPELESFIAEAKIHIQYKFWNKLKKKVTEICKLERFDAKGPRGDVSKKAVRQHYYPDNNRHRYFGISFRICKLCSIYDIGFRVELNDDERIYYGFVLLRRDGYIGRQYEQEEVKPYVDIASEVLKTEYKSSYWLGYKFPEYQNQYISFSDFGAEQMRYIADDAELEKMVETIALEIKDAVDKFIEAKKDAGL